MPGVVVGVNIRASGLPDVVLATQRPKASTEIPFGTEPRARVTAVVPMATLLTSATGLKEEPQHPGLSKFPLGAAPLEQGVAMPSVRDTLNRLVSVFALATGLCLVFGGAASRSSEKVLYSFRGGSDGASPFSTLIADGSGNLYGTTSAGGGGSCQFAGCGTVFKLASDGTESVLYVFTGGNDGAYPYAGLTSGGAGDYYGTTVAGGGCADNDACGTVFKLASDGTETVLYAFQGGSDGLGPVGGLIINQGNLYGTTAGGGNYEGADCTSAGCGTVFELSSDWKKRRCSMSSREERTVGVPSDH